ncbi:MAG TPA: hypothetical protein VKF84_06945 [Candidatus Sulfotelmatobacter sp.]|nr:hypothetical protein [Candidatus Sulfotelmatobacter sp.]
MAVFSAAFITSAAATLAGHADLSSFYDVTAVTQLATQLQSAQ